MLYDVVSHISLLSSFVGNKPFPELSPFEVASVSSLVARSTKLLSGRQWFHSFHNLTFLKLLSSQPILIIQGLPTINNCPL